MMCEQLKAWLAGLLAVLFLSSLLLTHILWLGRWPVETGSLSIAALVAIIFIWSRRRAGLARTGLEGPLVGLLVTTWLALAFSPDARMGLEKTIWLVAYGLLFYMLVDTFSEGLLPSRVPLYAVMLVSGIVAAMAVLETYVWYSGYWQTMGFGALPPFPYRFVGLLGHPNFYMALVNLCAPLAVVTFLRARRFRLRFGSALWLAFYAISVPFSSSRSGWVGMAVWLVLLAGLWLLLGGRWRRLLAWARRRVLLMAVAGCAVLLTGGYVAYRFILAFGAHPSHGGSAFGGSGREVFWAAAVRIWQDAWLTGAGPSRFVYEYLRVTDGFPPGFWAAHAHNFPLTWLAENGLLGILALLALVIVACWQLWRWYAACAPENRLIGGALLAGLAGFAVQSVFDDFSGIVLLMVLVSLFAAWLAAGVAAGKANRSSVDPVADAAGKPALSLRRWRLAQGWLLLPLLGVLGTAAWAAWNELPFWQARQAAQNGDWPAAAALAQQSAARDPFFVFYQVEAGLASARTWRDTQRPEDLQQALRLLRRAIELEPAYSLQWANLGVLEGLAGDRDAAEQYLLEAIRRAPNEPSYWLNLGALREAGGDLAGAEEAYRTVVGLAPGWAMHPFWGQTGLRRQLFHDTYAEGPAAWLETQSASEWRAACAAVDAGDLTEARRRLALSRAAGEDPLGILGCDGRLAEAEGNLDEARASYQAIENLLAGDYLADDATLSAMYARFHRRAGLDLQVVPGYLALGNEAGQFEALAAYYNLQVREDGCAAAYPTWVVWQRAMRGGALDRLPEPDCRPTVMFTGN